MTFFRLQAIGHNAASEQFNFGIHVNSGSDINTVQTAWSAALGILWVGPPTPAASVQQLFTTRLAIDESVTTQLDPGTGLNVEQRRDGEALVGTDAGKDLPPQVALAVSLRTVLPTRSGRGRFFLPSMAVSSSTNEGRLALTARDQVVAAAGAMLTALILAGHQPVIFHRNTISGTSVVRVDVGDVYDTQRRRRDRLNEARGSVGV